MGKTVVMALFDGAVKEGRTKKRGYWLVPLILSSLTIMAVVFLLWELLERKFFTQMDMRTLHYLYVSRGIILGLVLTTWSVWFVIKYRRQYEQAQQDLQAQLFQADKLAALGEMVGGVAHEINNPIGIMISRIELMVQDAKGQPLPSHFVRDLEVLQKHASRIGTIAQHLLSFARKSGAQHVEVDLNKVVLATVPLIDHEFKKKGVELKLLLPEEPPKIRGNFNQLQQVLLNLMTNARDALMDGNQIISNPQIQIGVWRVKDEPNVRLSVVDNGPAIPNEHLSRLFDPFYTTKETGTGLGLSVSYGIVKEHGGTLQVSNDGQKKSCGTCFTMTLPIGG